MLTNDNDPAVQAGGPGAAPHPDAQHTPKTWTAGRPDEAVALLEAVLKLVQARRAFLGPEQVGDTHRLGLTITLDEGDLIDRADFRFRPRDDH